MDLSFRDQWNHIYSSAFLRKLFQEDYKNPENLKTHPLLGSIFETFIVSEAFKRIYNLGELPQLYFWRDQSGDEIDLLIHNGQTSFPIEIKLSQTFHLDFKKKIEQWLTLKNNSATEGLVIYCGEHALQTKSPVPAFPWFTL